MSLKLIYAGLVIGLLTLATALRVADPTPVARLRLIVFDAYQQLWPRTYDPDLPVRVVLIDEASLKRFGQWPWPRSVLATLTKRLAESGAAVVGFDFVLAEPDRLLASELLKWLPPGPDAAALGEQIKQLPSGDVAFADAIATVPAVMGFIGVDDGTVLPVSHSGFAFAGDNPALYVPAFRGAVASLPLLQEKSAGSGALNWVPEFDQVVRRLPLLVRIGEQLYPSLAAEAIRIAQGATTFVVKASGASGEEAFGRNSGITSVQIGEYQIPTDANGQIWMRFTKSDPRRAIRASSVFDGTVARSELEGRIVLVGMGAAGLSDVKTTPLDASAAGVELHAQAIEQILLGDHLRRLDFARGAELVFLVFAGLALATTVYRFGALWSGVIGAAMLSAAIASSMVAYKSLGLLFDPAYLIAALTCLYIATTVFRYFQTETERTRVRDTFGRYLTDDVVARLLESPAGTQIGGEKSKVTMMMTDLRGFTSLSERVEPEQVVSMLNNYLGAMIQIIEQYRGTIDEFIGDAIFVLFGAPIRKEDDAQRAVACAVAMQLAMAEVNKYNLENGLPELEMGIGVHTGQVVVGNIGSAKRMKYGVIGGHVNLTSRIQSFTTGGQILISQATREEVDTIFIAGRRMELKAKGVEQLVAVFEVLGIDGKYNLRLPKTDDALTVLGAPVPLSYSMVEGASLAWETQKGSVTKLSLKEAEARLEAPVALLTNLQMRLINGDGGEVPGVVYGKVIEVTPGSGLDVRIRFTSMPPSITTFLRDLLAKTA
jgi:adenylate cyclase